MTSLTVIVPTVGRPTLADTLASLEGLDGRDEVIVVGDGQQIQARAYVAKFRRHTAANVRYLEVEGPSCFGNMQRDAGMAVAEKDWLLFMDDDDVYTPGALSTVRRTVEAQPGRPHIFRARWGAGHHAHGVVLWEREELWAANIATPMVVLPNRRYPVSWLDGDARGIVSDFAFLARAVVEAGEPVWCPDVVATVRPRSR